MLDAILQLRQLIGELRPAGQRHLQLSLVLPVELFELLLERRYLFAESLTFLRQITSQTKTKSKNNIKKRAQLD